MPESRNNATEASRHVGAAELTPSPTVAAKLIRMDDTAVAVRAPATIGVHCRVQASGRPVLAAGVLPTGGVSILICASPQAEERENRHDDHDQAAQVDNSVHVVLLERM